MSDLPASFDPDDARVVTGPAGQRARAEMLEQQRRLERRVHRVTDGVWSVVGNGLSNQSFVRGPEGLIAIDTGESIEEMAAALDLLAAETTEPIVAVLYTHSHYCGGTRLLFERAGRELPVWGHERIELNRRAQTIELQAAASRGLIHQFGVMLPSDGPDGLLGVGLGRFFRNPGHAPHTDGYVPATEVITGPTEVTVAGLRVTVRPAPSDADDSVTYWFDELGVAVQNLVWPALFNVFAIRGEEYRDPRVVVAGVDELLAFRPDHLVPTHGPPLSGAGEIAERATRYRDAIQFLWDQTVRGLNQGLTTDELVRRVQLPAVFSGDHLTEQHYGLAEHHVRQIRNGLRGWFDEDESALFPLDTAERYRRLIEGFGGRAEVADRARRALADDDLRWALELATWLVRSDDGDGRADGGDPSERALLAEVLRTVAHRTTSANVRNWCLTRARELDGHLDLSRFRAVRYSRAAVLSAPEAHVHGLRVVLDPDRAVGVDVHLAWCFTDGPTAGLHVRHHVAVPTDGRGADHRIRLSVATWADVQSGRTTMSEVVDSGAAEIDGDADVVRRVLECFDLASLRG